MPNKEETQNIRSWERDPDDRGWLLCVGFGPDPARRPMLINRDDGPIIVWVIKRSSGPRAFWERDRDGGAISGSYAKMTDLESMAWALEELALIARVRSVKYSEQLYKLMRERIMIGEKSS